MFTVNGIIDDIYGEMLLTSSGVEKGYIESLVVSYVLPSFNRD